MKTRLSFVSNSSSCCYVIAVKKWTPESTKLIEEIRKGRSGFSGDFTKMDCDGIVQTISDYRVDMTSAIQRCIDAEAYPPNKMMNGSSSTYGDQAAWAKEGILQIKGNLESIEAAEGEVFKISISYGDHEMNDLLETLKNEGVVEVLIDYY